MECQSYRFQYEDEPSIDYVTKYIATTQQRYTQKGGTRPFGVSCFVAGFKSETEPKLYMTEPSGSLTSWKANAIGKNAKNLREYLEKNYKEDMDEAATVRLGVETLLETVESEKNIEIAIMRKDKKTVFVSEEELNKVVEVIKKAKEDAK